MAEPSALEVRARSRKPPMEQIRSPADESSGLQERPALSPEAYAEVVQRRRALRIPGYATLADVGLDGPWVTPLQKTAGLLSGPVLIAFNWLDADSVEPNRTEIEARGYLSRIPFNRVVNRALELRGWARSAMYMSQCFHLLPSKRSGAVPTRLIDRSFEAVTRYEIAGRPVIALGGAAAGACDRAGVACHVTIHPSARGLSFEDRAAKIAKVLANVTLT